MTTQMTATEVKAKILGLLDEVAAGAEIEITKRGRPVARLVPIARRKPVMGSMRGTVISSANDEDLFTTGAVWNLT